jgi:hypothetical protein
MHTLHTYQAGEFCMLQLPTEHNVICRAHASSWGFLAVFHVLYSESVVPLALQVQPQLVDPGSAHATSMLSQTPAAPLPRKTDVILLALRPIVQFPLL